MNHPPSYDEMMSTGHINSDDGIYQELKVEYCGWYQRETKFCAEADPTGERCIACRIIERIQELKIAEENNVH